MHFLFILFSVVLFIHQCFSATISQSAVQMTYTTISTVNNQNITNTSIVSCTQGIISYTLLLVKIDQSKPMTTSLRNGTIILINTLSSNVHIYTYTNTFVDYANNFNLTNTTTFYCTSLTVISSKISTAIVDRTIPKNSVLPPSPVATPYNNIIPNYPNIQNLPSNSSFWTNFSQALFQQQNLARTQPKLYAQFINDQLKNFSSNGKNVMIGNLNYTTIQGNYAWKEAIQYLNNTAPTNLSALQRVKCLDTAAQFMVNNSAANSLRGHTDTLNQTPSDRLKLYCGISYGGENIAWGFSSARNCIIQLIVDDGVFGRGHRLNIFNPAYIQGGAWAGNYAASSLNDIAVFDYLQNA